MSHKKRFAAHCDTDLTFHDSQADAEFEANRNIAILREEAFDGWDEDTAEEITVLKVVKVARKVDPNADYRCVDYELRSLDDDTKGSTELTDERIETAFHGTDFGTSDHRSLLERGVLKRLTHYYNWATLTRILQELGLVDEHNEVTAAGRDFAWMAFGSQQVTA